MAQKLTMNVLIRGRDEGRFDRHAVKTVRQNAPSFSNGLLRGNKIVIVTFPRSANHTLTCHADILRYWSPKLRTLIDETEATYYERQQNIPRLPFPEAPTESPTPPEFVAIGITLRDVQLKTFAIFLEWAYCERLPATEPLLTTVAPADTDENQSNASFYHRQPEAQFLEAYIFARRYHVRDFRNDVFDSLWEIINWRTKGKEDDDSGSLMPSLMVLYRAITTLAEDDPARKFLSTLFNWYVPNKITSSREQLCAVELHQKWGFLAMHDTQRKEIRKGPMNWASQQTLQEALYCYQHHEHLGDESDECWATLKEGGEYWKRVFGYYHSDTYVLQKGDHPDHTDAEAKMTDNETDNETAKDMDKEMEDDGLPAWISTFNIWDSVEPESEPEDESFNADDGEGDEDEENEEECDENDKGDKYQVEREQNEEGSSTAGAEDRMEGIQHANDDFLPVDFSIELDPETWEGLESPVIDSFFQREVAERYRVPW